jgi:hypothetical protein
MAMIGKFLKRMPPARATDRKLKMSSVRKEKRVGIEIWDRESVLKIFKNLQDDSLIPFSCRRGDFKTGPIISTAR